MGKLSKSRKGHLRKSGVRRRVAIELLQRGGRHCHWCGDRLEWLQLSCGLLGPDNDLTVDHVEPASLGGSNENDNLVLACRACNQERALPPNDPIFKKSASQ